MMIYFLPSFFLLSRAARLFVLKGREATPVSRLIVVDLVESETFFLKKFSAAPHQEGAAESVC